MLLKAAPSWLVGAAWPHANVLSMTEEAAEHTAAKWGVERPLLIADACNWRLVGLDLNQLGICGRLQTRNAAKEPSRCPPCPRAWRAAANLIRSLHSRIRRERMRLFSWLELEALARGEQSAAARLCLPPDRELK